MQRKDKNKFPLHKDVQCIPMPFIFSLVLNALSTEFCSFHTAELLIIKILT